MGTSAVSIIPRRFQASTIADQIGMLELLSADGYSLVLSSIIAKYRPFLEVAGPAAIDRFLYTGERAKGESRKTRSRKSSSRMSKRQGCRASVAETGQSYRVSARAPCPKGPQPVADLRSGCGYPCHPQLPGDEQGLHGGRLR